MAEVLPGAVRLAPPKPSSSSSAASSPSSDPAPAGETLRCGLVVWSVGNESRPLIRAVSASLPEQRAFYTSNANAATVKLAVDPWLRVVGAENLLAAGDNALLPGSPLPATAQAAAQQGAFAARLLSRGYALGAGGLGRPPPHRPAAGGAWRLPTVAAAGGGGGGSVGHIAAGALLSSHPAPAAAASPTAPALGPPADYWEVAPVFEFLGLGLLAYVGSGSALTQLDAGNLLSLRLSGGFAYLLWRSVYVTKQARAGWAMQWASIVC